LGGRLGFNQSCSVLIRCNLSLFCDALSLCRLLFGFPHNALSFFHHPLSVCGGLVGSFFASLRFGGGPVGSRTLRHNISLPLSVCLCLFPSDV
jgi:hypothetical protein